MGGVPHWGLGLRNATEWADRGGHASSHHLLYRAGLRPIPLTVSVLFIPKTLHSRLFIQKKKKKKDDVNLNPSRPTVQFSSCSRFVLQGYGTKKRRTCKNVETSIEKLNNNPLESSCVFNELNQQRLTGYWWIFLSFLYFGLECRVIFHFLLVGHAGYLLPCHASPFRSRRRRRKTEKNRQRFYADTGPPWREMNFQN